MNQYAIVFARSARKELERLPERLGLRVLAKIEKLGMAPRSKGSRKIEGAENLWRIRVGEYRVVYAVDDRAKTIDIVAVRHRKDAYQ